jgi:hypothetical protein
VLAHSPKAKVIMSSVYFGGSRSLTFSSIIPQVVSAAIAQGHSVHVGCCVGADALVLQSISSSSFSQLRVFAQFSQSGQGFLHGVSNHAVHFIPASVVSWVAGGALSLPVHVRLIKRSIAAFQGCRQAVFFQPGSGSLAVASHAVRQGLQVFAFGSQPAPVPSCSGQWVSAQFMGFTCWRWSKSQLSLF